MRLIAIAKSVLKNIWSKEGFALGSSLVLTYLDTQVWIYMYMPRQQRISQAFQGGRGVLYTFSQTDDLLSREGLKTERSA